MTNLEQKAEISQRSIQAKRLLDAISNYKPTQQELKAMANAKKQMIRNIERKFQNSQPNSIYKFPFNSEVQKDQYQFQVNEQTTEIENLYEQNFLVDKFSGRSKQKQRPVLIEKNQNAKEKCFQIDLKSDTKNKQKDASVINNIQKAINSGLKCQTPKVIKKQIILTTKKHPQKQNFQSFISTQNTDIRSKLKIKKPNTVLNETKKQIILKTQNNINCKPYYQLSSHKKQNQKEDQSNKPMKTQNEVIVQENYEESLFFNSRTHQNIDQNTNFQYPKQSFNVFELKQKLRSASKSAKKDFTKRHKRTATQADSEIKIKIFTSSFKKPNSSHKDIQNQKKQLFSTSLFKKPENIESRSHFMNRTKSSLSQHSLKKGIKICGKMDQQYQKSQQKSQMKNNTLTLKGTSSSKKEGDSKAKKLFKDENKKEKQNIQENKVSKITSIMTSLKQGYKVKNATLKNHSKSKCGIKATICL